MTVDTQLTSRVEYLETALGNYGEQLRMLNNAVASLQLSANTQINAIRSLLQSRQLFQPKERSSLSSKLPNKIDDYSFETQLSMLKSIGYTAYDQWFKLLEPNLVSYQDDPEAGISVEENFGAQLFRDFVAPYAQGSVLDIGCGIAPMPVYLADFDPKLVVGSDPLSPEVNRDFLFHHGLAELQPWDDNSFDNVIVGTSMDHFLDPGKALEEAQRVLKPNGVLLLWMGFIPGGEPYDPMNFDSEPIDDFHLFHFDRSWFEPLLMRNFDILENIEVNEVSSFYACKPHER